jgi:hypothetical protein
VIKKILASACLILSLGLLAPAALAEDEPAPGAEEKPAPSLVIPQPDYLPGPPSGIQGEDTRNYLFEVTVPRALNIAVGLLGLGAFMAMLIAAITLLTAYGNEDKINRAKRNLQFSLIGFILIVFAFAIVSIVTAVALPSESSWIPTATALDIEETAETLLPSTQSLLENGEKYEVELPSGDLVSEIFPAVVSNILFFIGFLIFIAMMYGGILLVVGRGNEDMQSKAKSIIIWAMVALGIIGVGYAVIYGIATLNLENDPGTDADDVFLEQNVEPGLFGSNLIGAVQLPSDLKPANIPDIEIEEANDGDNPESAATQTLILFVGRLLSRVLVWAGVVAVVFLIVAGTNYILAFGKDERIEKGKRGVFWTLLGLLIILLAYAIVQAVIQVVLSLDGSGV